MTAFKNILCCLAATLTFISVSAQSVQDRFVSAAKNHSVEFSYSFVMHASAPVSGNGTAKVQGECFSVDGNGMKVMCDGRTRWIVDEKAREVIVESVTGDEESLMVDPALIVKDLNAHFKTVSSSAVMEKGQQLVKVQFAPRSSSAGISSMTIWFSEKNHNRPVIAKASLKMKDGTVTDFTVPSMSFAPLSSLSQYVFPTSGLDPSWVVTEL